MRRALRGSACFVRRMRSSCPVPKFFPCKAELSMRPKRGDNRGKPVKFVPFTSALCWMLGKRIVCLRPPALRQNNGAALGAAPLKRANLRQMHERGGGISAGHYARRCQCSCPNLPHSWRCFPGPPPLSWPCIFGRILGNTARGRLLLMQRNSVFLGSAGDGLSSFAHDRASAPK